MATVILQSDDQAQRIAQLEREVRRLQSLVARSIRTHYKHMPYAECDKPGRALMLEAAGVDYSTAKALSMESEWCQCGGAVAAVGIFHTLTLNTRLDDPNELTNAMLLCEACAGDVDQGVRVVWLR
jgi:hypothetical protein